MRCLAQLRHQRNAIVESSRQRPLDRMTRLNAQVRCLAQLRHQRNAIVESSRHRPLDRTTRLDKSKNSLIAKEEDPDGSSVNPIEYFGAAMYFRRDKNGTPRLFWRQCEKKLLFWREEKHPTFERNGLSGQSQRSRRRSCRHRPGVPPVFHTAFPSVGPH